MTLPTFAAERGRLQEISIDGWNAAPAPAASDRYLQSRLTLGRSAANQPHATAAVDRRDRQTGSGTDRRPTVRPCSAYLADSVNNALRDRY